MSTESRPTSRIAAVPDGHARAPGAAERGSSPLPPVRCEPTAPAARVWRARLRLWWLVQDPHDGGGGEAGEFLDPCDAQTGSGGLAHRVIAAHGPPVAQVVLGGSIRFAGAPYVALLPEIADM